MKILKKGNPWFVGRKATCNECGCRVQLEMGDKPQVYFPFAELKKGTKRTRILYEVGCPNCGQGIKIEQ